jgi:hypothetical protein
MHVHGPLYAAVDSLVFARGGGGGGRGPAGKDAWKVRNEALGTVVEKATQAAKYGIVPNAAVRSVLQALVRRLADTNQNLRPKAADGIAAIATGVGPDVEKV